MSINDNVRDAAYIVIGMGVIGAQRAQVRREEIRKQLDEQRAAVEARGAEAVNALSEVVKQAEARVKPVISAVETQIRALVNV